MLLLRMVGARAVSLTVAVPCYVTLDNQREKVQSTFREHPKFCSARTTHRPKSLSSVRPSSKSYQGLAETWFCFCVGINDADVCNGRQTDHRNRERSRPTQNREKSGHRCLMTMPPTSNRKRERKDSKDTKGKVRNRKESTKSSTKRQ